MIIKSALGSYAPSPFEKAAVVDFAHDTAVDDLQRVDLAETRAALTG